MEIVRVVGPDLQMFPHHKELFAVVYEMLQDVFVNKFRMCFVQQTHLPELTDSMGMFYLKQFKVKGILERFISKFEAL